MRLFLLALLLPACGAPVCRPGTCPAGQHCVFVGAENTPACRPACELGDAGTTCGAATCACGATCAGCENCIAVCQ
ncbi:MAG: hypothetical protein ACOZQL_29950 [Myxococcota bacterium]